MLYGPPSSFRCSSSVRSTLVVSRSRAPCPTALQGSSDAHVPPMPNDIIAPPPIVGVPLRPTIAPSIHSYKRQHLHRITSWACSLDFVLAFFRLWFCSHRPFSFRSRARCIVAYPSPGAKCRFPTTRPWATLTGNQILYKALATLPWLRYGRSLSQRVCSQACSTLSSSTMYIALGNLILNKRTLVLATLYGDKYVQRVERTTI
jgi:hypothetical protein